MDLKKLEEECSSLEKKHRTYSDEIDDLEEKQDHLKSAIADEKTALENIKDTLNSLQDTADNLERIIRIHQNESYELPNKLAPLKEKLSDIDKKLADKKAQLENIRNQEMCKKALSMDIKNSYRKIIKRNTSTTPIITEFCKSDKEFFVLDVGMRLPGYKNFSYIIIKNNKIISEAQENVPTMSEIKSVAGKNIQSVEVPRMQYLKKNILNSVKQYKTLSPKLIIPFSKPCLIGGQSDANQSGYGWEWDWSYGVGDYTEGTYYGEMTGFFVIGIQINESEFY